MTVFVIGGAGALGRAFIADASKQGHPTVNVDLHPNPQAHHNLPPYPDYDTLRGLASASGNVVVCAAGSWIGGSLSQFDAEAIDTLVDTNLKPALWSAGLAKCLPAGTNGGTNGDTNGGTGGDTKLILTSAHATLSPQGTPAMAAYGAVKAAVNHVAETSSGSGTPTLLLLPAVLDTPANRRDMGEGNVAQWTPCGELAEYALKLPVSTGTVTRVSVLTKQHHTEFKLL